MKVKTSLYLDEELIKTIRRLAKENRRSFASMTNLLLSEKLLERKK